MTALDVTLSPSLQTTLEQPGVSAYAVYFTSSGTVSTANWSTLDTNGTIMSNGTAAIALPDPYISGKVYVIIQSQDPAGPQSNLTTLITSQADINASFAAANDFAYDSFEINLSGSATDVANLTSINEFGLPLDLNVDYSGGGTASSGYNLSATSIENALSLGGAVISTYTSGALAGDFSMAQPPSGTAGASLWAPFVTSLEDTLSGTQAPAIILSGIFNGANNYTPSLGTLNPPDSGWHNYAYYAYQLEFSGTDGDFWLVPIAGSQVQGDIKLTPADLEQIVFGPPGTIGIYSSTAASGTLFLSMNEGANNQWSAVLAKLETGMDAGFFGAAGDSQNPQVTTAINLDESTNWSALNAYGNSLASTPYENLVSLASNAVSYDQYAAVFLDHSNSYGMPYTDLLTADYVTGGPQLDVYDTATANDVSTINLTVFANGETPSGYTTPTSNTYIEWTPTTLAPTTIMGTIVPGATISNGYVIPDGGSNATNVVLSIGSPSDTTALVTLNKTGSITLKILTAETPNGQGGYTPTWDSVTLDGATAGTAGLWQLWNISYNSATGTHSAAADSSAPAYTPGTLLINQFPTSTAANATGWYQIVIGDKTYNLYTTTQNGAFDNTNIATLAGSLAIDGGGVIAVPAGTASTAISTMTLIFPVDTASTVETIDPDRQLPRWRRSRACFPTIHLPPSRTSST